jgi:hypothetical protein
MSIGGFVFLAVIAAIVYGVVRLVRRANRSYAELLAKNEAYFTSMFADLQPLYHPKNVLEFVRARLAQAPARGGMTMKGPPGFAASSARVSFETDKKGRERELWVLLDEAGSEISRFFFDADEKDGMVRVGEGKFRVGRKEDRVRYWHPDREFKWAPPNLWKFTTRVFDREVDTDRGTVSYSDSSSSSTSRTASTAAAAAGIVAAGGTFDGGGASAGWDDTPSSPSDGSDGSAGSESSGTESAATSY